MHNLVFEAAIGDRKIQASFEGVNLERQRHALKRLVDTFFDDLDEEIGLTKEFENEEIENIEEIKAQPEKVAAALPTIEETKKEIQEDIPVYEDKTVKGFTMAEIARNYGSSESFGGSVVTKTIDIDTYADYPDEIQQAIKAGVNERNFKVHDNGKPHFQAYYICTGCNHKGKRFIPLGRKSLTCHDCGKRMITRKAVDVEFPHNDRYGNMFIAGDFKRTNEFFDVAAQNELKKQEKVYLA